MKYLCAQPRTPFYKWQVEVMLKNFLKNGISGSDIIVLVSLNRQDYSCSAHAQGVWDALYNRFPEVYFYEYLDTRETQSYAPSIYFNLVKQFLKANPDFEKETIFFHDADIVFTRKVNFSKLLQDDIWYFSDTIPYIGAQYILGKGPRVYNDMCEIVGIDILTPILNEKNSGGAQHIIKCSTYAFWDKVEQDSIALYQHFCETEHQHTESDRKDYPIQKWTAGMWSLLWNAWLFKKEVKVVPEMDFCVATDPIHMWYEKPIMHNAQVLPNHTNLFFKENYRLKEPYDIDLNAFSKDHCSYNYAKEILS